MLKLREIGRVGAMSLIGSVALLTVTAVFWTLFKPPHEPQRYAYAATILAFGASLACLILWLSDVTKILSLMPGVRRGIWASLVVVLLGAVAARVTSPPTPAPPLPRVHIDCLSLVERGRSPSGELTFSRRTDPRYTAHPNDITFLTTFSDFALDKDGRPDLEFTICLVNGNTGVAEVMTRTLGNDPAAWQSRNPESMQRQVRAICEVKAGAYPYVASLTDLRSVGEGQLFLRLTVIDRLTSFAATRDLPIYVGVGPPGR